MQFFSLGAYKVKNEKVNFFFPWKRIVRREKCKDLCLLLTISLAPGLIFKKTNILVYIFLSGLAFSLDQLEGNLMGGLAR